MHYIFGSKDKKTLEPLTPSTSNSTVYIFINISLEIGENNERLKINWFVDKKNSVDKRQLENKDLGLEFHTDVANDDDFYKKIFETNSYYQGNKAPLDNRQLGSQQSVI